MPPSSLVRVVAVRLRRGRRTPVLGRQRYRVGRGSGCRRIARRAIAVVIYVPMASPARSTGSDPVGTLEHALAGALAAELGVDTDVVATLLTPPSRPEMGDVAIACHRLAKPAGATPPELARRLAATAAGVDGVASAAAAGPFLNVRWDPAAVAQAVLDSVVASRDRPAGLVGGDEGAGTTWVVDFSSPNAARTLGFHHLRGTALGAALARLYEARGHRVVRVNHLGDFGHNIALLLYKLDTSATADAEVEALDPQHLQALYVEANEDEAARPDAVGAAAARWLELLNDGDPTARRRWELIVDATKASLDLTYARMGIHFDEYRGESRYDAEAREVSRELVDAGVAEVDPDGGAVFVAPHEGHQAIVLVTRRGASTYESRDAAAAIERHRDFGFDRCVYLTDIGQGGRFGAVFAALVRAGHGWAATCEHVGFGQMRLGGQKAKTREGRVVSLDEVLDEAVARAADQVAERAEPLDDPAAVAEAVGVGAVLFGQCRMRRMADFEFDLEDALAFKGETAPRIQYAYARIMSILTKAATTLDAALRDGDPGLLADPAETRVLLAIGGLGPAARRAYESDDPSYLCDGLVAVADAWASYQNAGRDDPALRVLSEDETLRRARLRLAAATAVAVRDGLAVLGVGVPERM